MNNQTKEHRQGALFVSNTFEALSEDGNYDPSSSSASSSGMSFDLFVDDDFICCPPEGLKMIASLNKEQYQHQYQYQHQHQHQHQHQPLSRGGLTSKHLDLIASRNWKAVLSWITFHPDEVSTLVDRECNTCLHHACLFRAPLNVIEAMLFAAPSIASIQNDEGELPLHWAVRLALPLQVLKVILNAYPHSGFTHDATTTTPFSILWDRHEPTLNDVFRIHGQQKLLSFPSWTRLTMLIQSSTKISTDHYLLHAAAACGCPISFLQFSIKLTGTPHLSKPDDTGDLPLHSASSSPYTNCDHIRFWIDSYPPAVRIRDARGRLPIHRMIASGKRWEEGVEVLVRHHPVVMQEQDPSSNLFPFMIAGSSANPDVSTIYHLLQMNPVHVGPL